MAKDPHAEAWHRLHVCHSNYVMACSSKELTRTMLDEAIRNAAEAGLSNAEIGRAIGTTGQRVGQIVSAA